MIAIPNMEKPEHCYECLLRQGNCCLLLYEAIPPTVPLTRLDDCPLIEIDLVRCKDCKHYDTESRTFPCCTDIYGAVRYMEADGFCSKGERRTDDKEIL